MSFQLLNNECTVDNVNASYAFVACSEELDIIPRIFFLLNHTV